MQDIETRIEADDRLVALRDWARERIDSSDRAHDISHCYRVARWTLRCGGEGVDVSEAIAAALLHDIVNVPKDHPERARASARSAKVAREQLASLGFGADATERICDAIADHSFSAGRTPRSGLGDALQDADRLETLGALGLFRMISTGSRMKAAYFHFEDPWAEKRSLDDRRYTLDHFFTKVMRLAEGMRTARGQAEAERRTRFLRAFLDELRRELSGGDAAGEA